MTTTTHLLTADDLWNMPNNGDGYELVNGELRPMPPSGNEHSTIGVNLLIPLGGFVKNHKLGKVTGADGGYLIRRNPDTVRAPDIGFVQTSRLPNGKATKKFFPAPPDLAVEIISPHDVYEEVDEKVKEFLEAGVRIVWVVNPRRKEITIFRPDNTTQLLKAADQLTCEDVISGFSIPVADIFD